jgi:hypothetical protein
MMFPLHRLLCLPQRKVGAMPQFSIAVTMFLAGLALIIFIAFGLWALYLKARRRTLASALVGELVGILRIIETGRIEARLHEAGGKRLSGRANPKKFVSSLPSPVIFEANTNRLDLFKPSMARKIAHVYILLAGVKESLPLVATDSGQAAATLTQLQEALGIADEVLRNLRPLL